MANCVFCNIQAGQIPAAIVHESNHGLVIMDGYPLAPGHTLIISRSHSSLVNGLVAAERHALFDMGAKIDRALRRADPSIIATNWLINDGKGAYQHVPHVHLHIIPRRKRDTLGMPLRLVSRVWTMRKPPQMAPLQSWAERIRAELVTD